ncbi:hypothetical protein Tco_0295716, partial [Tanacetum coccineum]
IMMANLLPFGHNADFPMVEPIQPEHAQDMHDPDEVLSDVKEDLEEEPELVPAALANMNGWIECDVPLENPRDVPAENPKDDEKEELEEEEL